MYEYCKPRAPIAAMFGSPGPCYGLPGLVGHPEHDPRSVHNKYPAYSFGIKHGKFRDDCSPGPCYQPNMKIYRDGADGTPHYSLYARHRDLTQFKNPGPGAYSPEKAGPMAHFHHPTYAFGTRHRHRKSDNTPAPNNYSLDGMMGKTVQSRKSQAPIFSMRPKYTNGAFYEDLSKTPGPGTYVTTVPDIYKNKQPIFSMTSRNVMPGDASQKPGPGAHSPEKVYVNKKRAASFSFGIRHSAYEAPLIVDCVD